MAVKAAGMVEKFVAIATSSDSGRCALRQPDLVAFVDISTGGLIQDEATQYPNTGPVLSQAQGHTLRVGDPGHQYESRPFSDRDQFCRLGHGHGQGFLHEDVFARLQGRACKRIMRARRRSDGDGFDIAGQEWIEIIVERGGAIEIAGLLQTVRVGIADGAEIGAGSSVEVTGEVGTPVAEADESNAGYGHSVGS